MTSRTLLHTLALGTAALLAEIQLPAQTWQTVLDYQLAPGQSASGHALAADASGNVFSGGAAMDATKTGHGLVLRTDTTAVNWHLSDDTNPDPTHYNSFVWRGLGFDPAGNLYSVGTLTPKCSSRTCPGSSWYVRKTSNGGASWSTVDSFQYAPGNNSAARAFVADLVGNVCIAGYGTDATGVMHWLIRRSVNGGSWTLVDDFPAPSTRASVPTEANAAHVAPGLGLFVVGQIATQSGNVWLVRRSLNGGVTWSTVDTFQLVQGLDAYAYGVSSDNQGNVYVGGGAIASQTAIKGKVYYSRDWIVRKSSDGGNTWATADVFSNTGAATFGLSMGRDSAGNVVEAGSVQDAQGVSHWLVRRPDASGVWQTIDDFQLAPGFSAQAESVVTDAAGNLLVTGGASDAAGAHWIVRRF
jgi:hypothetical protein